MKITKEQLKQIIKEELGKITETYENPEGGELAYDGVQGEVRHLMNQIVPIIDQTYNMFGPDNELKKEFEIIFMKNMQLIADKWKAGRGETPSSQMTSDERLAHMHDFVSKQDSAPAGENPFRGPDPATHRKMRMRARQGKHGTPTHESKTK